MFGTNDSDSPKFLVSREGNILETNKVVEECLGYGPDTLTGHNVATILNQLDLEKTYSEVQVVSSSGTPLTFLAINSQIVDESLRPFRHIISLTEVEKLPLVARRLAEGQAKAEARKVELQQFISCITHDLRSPLVSVEGFVVEMNELMNDLLVNREKACSGPLTCSQMHEEFTLDMQVAMGFVDSSVKRLKRLVNSVVDLHKNRNRNLNDVPTDISKLCEMIENTMQHQVEKAKCFIRVSPSMPKINIDPSVAERIFGNILDNSVKYLDPSRPGTVDVYCVVKDQRVIFSIRDNGIGISENGKQYVFQMFRRATDLEIPGDGVGMPMVKSLLDHYQGEVWFNSKEGVGTTFYVSFPKTMLA